MNKKDILKLRKIVEKDWGKECKDFSIGCVVCQMHLALKIIEHSYDIDLLLKRARKHKSKIKEG